MMFNNDNSEKIGMFILLLCAFGFCTVRANFLKKNWCADVTDCYCYKLDTDKVTAENQLFVSCDKYDIRIMDLLPVMNISILQFKYVSSSTTESLRNLRNKTTQLKKLSLSGGSLQYFDMRWLPDMIKELTIKEVKIDQFIPQNRNSSLCKNEKVRLKNLTKLTLTKLQKTIPCIPDSVSKILLVDINITNGTAWPKSLAQLKITFYGKGSMPQNSLQQMKNLTLVWLTSIPLREGNIPHIGSESTLKHLMILSCNLHSIQPESLLKFKKLHTVNMKSNRISRFYAKLPLTVKTLLLSFNEITEISKNQWLNSSLKILYLNQNHLESMPLGLPNTIEDLNLAYNQISNCPIEAFHHLSRLKILDLSHNRLLTMPLGIHPGLLDYSISYNLISLVPGSQAYNFCTQCRQFGFGNNKWLCDDKFFEMMLWIVTNADNDVIKTFYLNLHSFSHGECTSLPKNALTKKYLEHAKTFMQQLKIIPFANCRYESQKILNCTNANLDNFPNSPPDGLKKVVIKGNKNLKETPDYIFSAQTTLKGLELNENNLKRIPYGLPSMIMHLSLQYNNITELSSRDVEAFSFLKDLKELYLEGNKIRTLYSNQFKYLTKLRWIGLESNELVCDCSLQSLIEWYQKLIPVLHYGSKLARYARCKYPTRWNDRDIRKMHWIYEYELQCRPPSCKWKELEMDDILNCSIAAQKEEKYYMFSKPDPVIGALPNIPRNKLWKSLIISGLKLNDDDIQLKHLKNLIHVDISENQLTRLPIENLPTNVEELQLNKNYITNLPTKENILQNVPKLRLVNLRNNKIKILSVKEVQLLPVIGSVFMRGNPFVCNCTLNHFITWVKANGSSLSQNGKYDIQELRCDSPKEIMDQRIQDISSEDVCQSSASIILKAGISAMVAVIILTLLIVVFLYMKRRRDYKAQILNGFQKLLQQENTLYMKQETFGKDNETFVFDCFVASEDTEHDNKYLEKIIQELEEKRGYTLCIAHRDFPPGEDIAENIVRCIGSSKCIILLLSKSFISSPWCQYEVQVALTELHERQRKLLVPILITDWTLKDNIQGAVKSFISTIPPTKAPALNAPQREWEKFWKTFENLLNA